MALQRLTQRTDHHFKVRHCLLVKLWKITSHNPAFTVRGLVDSHVEDQRRRTLRSYMSLSVMLMLLLIPARSHNIYVCLENKPVQVEGRQGFYKKSI